MRNILVLAFFSMLFSCSPNNVDSTHSTVQNVLKPCPSFQETGKPALVYGAECGELQVKENPADPNSAKISIAILRLPAISPAPIKDPLFLIQGGPGGSSIDMAEMIFYAFSDVRKTRDLVFVDQRGTGKSNPLACEKSEVSDSSTSVQREKNRIRYQQCAEKYKNNAAFYTTPYAVKDLDDVRKALDYPQINLWGVSYGTRVALEYMREFPAQTRVVILDGVAPVQIALPKYFQEDAMKALHEVNAECSAQEKCKAEFGNIIEKANRVNERLAAADAAEKSISVEFKHPRNNTPKTETLTANAFAQLLFMSLYSRDLTVLLPHAIANAERGDYQLIATLFTLAFEQKSFANISEAMRFSVVCNEDFHLITADDIANSKNFFGLNMFEDFTDACKIWPKSTMPENYFEPIASQHPVLLLSGGRDPVTPSHWAQLVASHLPNSLQIVAPGGNHSISMDGCVSKIMAQFLQSASVAALNTDCVKDIKPLPIVLGANENISSSSKASSSVSTVAGGEQ